MAVLKKERITDVGEDVEKRKNWHSYYGKIYGDSSKNLRINHHMTKLEHKAHS